MDTAKLKDYGTTLLFFAVAAIVAYQPQIMPYVPAEYSILALIGFGILSQLAADKRVKVSVAEVNQKVDEAQKVAADVSTKIDEVQETIEEGAA